VLNAIYYILGAPKSRLGGPKYLASALLTQHQRDIVFVYGPSERQHHPIRWCSQFCIMKRYLVPFIYRLCQGHIPLFISGWGRFS